jgi:hypothetical protein
MLTPGVLSCTAVLIAPDVAITAAHCVALNNSCTTNLTTSTQFTFAGQTVLVASPPRVLLPGLDGPADRLMSPGTLLPSDYDQTTAKCAGVPTSFYINLHRDQDFAVVLLASSVQGVPPIDVWNVSAKEAQDRLAAIGGAAIWQGRAKPEASPVTLQATGTVALSTHIGDACDQAFPTASAFSPVPIDADLPFFAAVIGADGTGATEHGDSGGPPRSSSRSRTPATIRA